ncbi:TPA: hypothetical protein ACJ12Z_002539 [Klebsiella pneumoniae]
MSHAIDAHLTDEVINAAFENTNFGRDDFRTILAETVMKRAAGYHSGWTATNICMRLGLLSEKNQSATKLGLTFAFHHYYRQSVRDALMPKQERAASAKRWIFEPVTGSKQFTHSFSYALTISNGTEMYSPMKGGLVVAERHLSQLIAVMEIRPFIQLTRKVKESLRFCLSLKCLESGSEGLSMPAILLTRKGRNGKAGRPIR